MDGELVRITGQCDSVWCDIAMLVPPDMFERTWGRRAPIFWPETTLVRRKVPGFCFVAEVYWELNARGLYLDMRPWGYHVFDVTAQVAGKKRRGQPKL